MKSFLKNNPNYYIDGGETTSSTVNIDIKKILDYQEKFKINNGIIDLFISSNSIGWTSFLENEENYTIIVSSIKSDFIGKGYGKKIYLKLAQDAKEKNKTLISQEIHNLNNNTRYLWNSLIYSGLAEFKQDGMYFKFINKNIK